MQVRRFTEPAELARLASAWDELVTAADGPVLARPTWCLPWVHHRLGPAAPEVTTVWEGSELVALAPLQRRRLGPVEVVRFLGHGMGTTSTLVVRPGFGEAGVRLWAAVSKGPGRVVHLVEHTGPTLGFTRGAAARHVEVTERDRCVVIDTAGGHAAYLAGRSKKLRENLRRARRSAEAAGGWTVEVVEDLDRLAAVRTELVGVHDAAEAVEPRLHPWRGDVAPFTDAVLDGAARSGSLRVFVGRVGGEAAAVGIAFSVGTTLSFWSTRCDPAHAPSSVGTLLLDAVVAHGFEAGHERVDLLLGDGEHKRRWATGTYPTHTVLAARTRSALAVSRAVLHRRESRLAPVG